MKSIARILAVAFLVLGNASLALAAPAPGLLGQTVRFEAVISSLTSTLFEGVVGAGVELPGAYLDIDIGDDFILFDASQLPSDTSLPWSTFGDDINGYRLTDLNGTVADIIGFTIGATSNTNGELVASDLSFTADTATADFSGLEIGPGPSVVRLDLAFAGSAPAVPEPSSIVLVGSLGLVGLAYAGRRKLVS